MAQALPLLVLESQVQALAQADAVAQVWEPEPVREQTLAQVRGLELALEPLELQLELAVEPLELMQERPRVQEQQLAQQPELAAVPVQARELRVSRQLELQQHRLPTAAQERPPYLPALPMKAPCWGAPAW